MAARHGLVLTAAELILLILYFTVTSLVSMATLGLGCVLGLVLPFAWIAVLVLHVVAIIKGINGTRLMVPGVSDTQAGSDARTRTFPSPLRTGASVPWRLLLVAIAC